MSAQGDAAREGEHVSAQGDIARVGKMRWEVRMSSTLGTASHTRILVVEDDDAVAQTLLEVLAGAGYEVRLARTGAEAETIAEMQRPDLVILDLILPDVDGLVLCANLKARLEVPIIVCSATHRRRDAVLSLKLGADDFIAKPFHIDELEARVQAVLRRAQPTQATAKASLSSGTLGLPAGSYQIGALTIDRLRRRAVLGSQPLHLTPTEYRLLCALAGHADHVVTREELAQLVWGYQDVSAGRAIDVHIRRLRAKLAGAGTPAPPIVSVRGLGYKMVSEPPSTRTSVA